MVKKLEIKKLIIALEKNSRKTKKAIWKDLAERIDKPTRHNVVININKLNNLAQKFKGKTLIVPGKILSLGELEEKVTIVAVSASEKAIEKISKKGKYIPLKDFLNEKINTKDLVVVK